jgi:uncharacterized protein (DUF4213/DUF364 family)
MHPITTLSVRLAERLAAALRAPRVRALHLPPPTGTKEAEFCALELDDGSIGFTYIQLAGTEAALRARHGALDVPGMEAATLARGFATQDAVQRAIGLAAINALSQQLFTRAGWEPPATGDSLGAITPRPGGHIGMVGLFSPLLPLIDATGAHLTVLELQPALVREQERLRVTLDPGALATCEQVVSTCSVLLNDTLDGVLAACRQARHVALVGPTAGCLPDPLFARCVHAVGGRRVTHRQDFLAAFQAGAKWGACAKKYVITRQDYPGVDALLARLGS